MTDWTRASVDYRLAWVLGRMHQRCKGDTDEQAYLRLKKRADKIFGKRPDTEMQEYYAVLGLKRL